MDTLNDEGFQDAVAHVWKALVCLRQKILYQRPSGFNLLKEASLLQKYEGLTECFLKETYAFQQHSRDENASLLLHILDILCYCFLRPDLAHVVECVAPGLTVVLVPWMGKTILDATQDDTIALFYILLSRLVGHPLLISFIQNYCLSFQVLEGLFFSMDKWFHKINETDTKLSIDLILLGYGFQALLVIVRTASGLLHEQFINFYPFIRLALQIVKLSKFYAFESVRISAFGFLCVGLGFPSVIVERLSCKLKLESNIFSLYFVHRLHWSIRLKQLNNLKRILHQEIPLVFNANSQSDINLSMAFLDGPFFKLSEYLTELVTFPPNSTTLALTKFPCDAFEKFGIQELGLWCSYCLPSHKLKQLLSCEPTRSLKIFYKGSLAVLGKYACLFVGPPSSGKSHCLQILYHMFGKLQLSREKETPASEEGILWLYLDAETDSRSLIGSWQSSDRPGTFIWKDGVLTQAMLSGRWLVVENINKCSRDISTRIQEIAETRTLNIAERHRKIIAHKNFRLFGTITTLADVTSVNDDQSLSQQHSWLLRYWKQIKCPPLSQDDVEFIAKVKYPKIASMISYFSSAFYSLVNHIDANQLKELKRNMSHRVLFRYLSRVESRLAGVSLPLLECQRLQLVEDFYYSVALSYAYRKHRYYLCRIFGEALQLMNEQVMDVIERKQIISEKDNNICIGGVWISRNSLQHKKITVNREINFSYNKLQNAVIRGVVSALVHSESVLLVGSTGSGKTSLVQKLASLLNYELVVYNFSEQSESCDLVGRFVQRDILSLVEGFNEQWTNLLKETDFLNANQKRDLHASAQLRYCASDWRRYLAFIDKVCSRIEADFSQSDITCDQTMGVLEWSRLHRQVEELKEHPSIKYFQTTDVEHSMQSVQFQFEEGALVTALREGKWLVLDEINLAPSDILQRLKGLLSMSTNIASQPVKFILTENSGEEILPHPNFRLFGCMNPPTQIVDDLLVKETTLSEIMPSSPAVTQSSAGKKELPEDIRNCFAEFFVDEIIDIQDLVLILQGLLPPNNEVLAERVASFYIESRKLSAGFSIVTALGTTPHFSLRTLSRAVEYASCVMSRRWIPRALMIALADGIIANFMTGLTRDSFDRMMSLVVDVLKLDTNSLVQLCKTPSRGTWKEIGDSRLMPLDYVIENQTVSPSQFTPLTYEMFSVQHDLFDGKQTDDIIAKAVKNLPINQINLNGPRKEDIRALQVRWVRIEGYPIQCGSELIDVAKAYRELIITPAVQRTIQNIARILSGSRVPILLEGPTSSGKSSLVRFMCQITGHRFIRINNHDHTDVQEYLGQHMMHPSTGKLVFVEGVIAQAARYGHWVILDELNLAPCEVLESLNRLLDGNRQLFIPETNTYINAHADFMIFATQNPSGGIYGGRKTLSTAFRNRFIEMSCEELPPEELEIILQKRCQLPPSFTKSMVNVYKELKTRRLKTCVFESSASFMTIRDLLRWGLRRPESRESLAREGYYLIGERLRDTEEKEVVFNIIVKCCLGGKNHTAMNLDFQNDPFVLLVKEKLVDLQRQGMRLSITDAIARLIVLTSRAIQHDEPVLLVGETGSGKTFLCQILALVAALPLRIVNCHQQTEAADLIGSLQPVKNRASFLSKIKRHKVHLVNTIESYQALISKTNEPLLESMEQLLTEVCEFIHSHVVCDEFKENTGAIEATSSYQSSTINAITLEKFLMDVQSKLLQWKTRLIFTYGSPYVQTRNPKDASVSTPLYKVVSSASSKKNKRAMVSHNVLPSSSSLDTQVLKRSRITLPSGKYFDLEGLEAFQEALAQDVSLLVEWVRRSEQLFEWVDGPLVKCMKEGAFLLLDEISLADDAVLERLNSVLEPGRSLVLAEKGCVIDKAPYASHYDQSAFSAALLETLKAKESFQVVATMNPGGDFGKRELSPALRNRFTEIWVPPIQFNSSDMLTMLYESFEARFRQIGEIKDVSSWSYNLHGFAQLLQRVICWYNSQVKYSLSLREALCWIEFVVSFVSRYLFFSKEPKSVDVPSLTLQGFFHGGMLICLDSFHIGNQLCGKLLNEIEGNEESVIQEYFFKYFFQFMLQTAKELFSTYRDEEFVSLCQQFEQNGFRWLYDALNDVDFIETQRQVKDKKTLKIGPFLIPYSEMQCDSMCINFNERFSCSFDFTSPTTAINLGRVIRALQIPRAILLEGPPGAGKTSLIQSLAAVLGNRLIRINLSEQTDLSDLLGSDLPQATRVSLWCPEECVNRLDRNNTVTLKSETFRWVDGVLLDAMIRGYWVLLDELNLASQQILEGLNALLDHRKEIFIPELDRTIHCAPTFRLFAAQNPMQHGGGRRGIPRSFLNRFSRISIRQLTQMDLKCIALSQWSRAASSGLPSNSLPYGRSDRILDAVEAIKNENKLCPFTGSVFWDWNLRDVFRFISLAKQGQPSCHLETTSFVVLMSRLCTVKDAKRALEQIFKCMECSSSILNEHGLSEMSVLKQCLQELGIKHQIELDETYEKGKGTEYLYTSYAKSFRLPIRSSVVPQKNEIQIGGLVLPRCCSGSLPHVIPGKYVSGFFSSQSHLIAQMGIGVALNWPILLTGERSSGKTSSVCYLAECCGATLHIYTLTESVDISELLGSYEPESLSELLALFESEVKNIVQFLCIMELNENAESCEAIFPVSLLRFVSEILCCDEKRLLEYFVPTVPYDEASLSSMSFQSFFKQMKDGLKRVSVDSVYEKANQCITALERLFFLIQNKYSQNVKKLQFRWNDGLLIECIERGDWLLLRHIHNASPSLLDRLNSLLEPNGFLFLTECGNAVTIQPHPNFRVFFTTDSYALLGGRLSKALHNRCLEIHFGCSSLLALKSLSETPQNMPSDTTGITSGLDEFEKFVESECSVPNIFRNLLLCILESPVAEPSRPKAVSHDFLVLYLKFVLNTNPYLLSSTHPTSVMLFDIYDLFKFISCDSLNVDHPLFTPFTAIVVFLALKLFFYILTQLSDDDVKAQMEYTGLCETSNVDNVESACQDIIFFIQDLRFQGLDHLERQNIILQPLQEWITQARVASFINIQTTTHFLLDQLLETSRTHWLNSLTESSWELMSCFIVTLFEKVLCSFQSPLWSQAASLLQSSTLMLEPPAQFGDVSGCLSPLYQLLRTVVSPKLHRYYHLSSLFRYCFKRFSLLWDMSGCPKRCFFIRLVNRTLTNYFERLDPGEFLEGTRFLESFFSETLDSPSWLSMIVVQFLANLKSTYKFFILLGNILRSSIASIVKCPCDDLSPLELYDALFYDISQENSQVVQDVDQNVRLQHLPLTVLTELATIYRVVLKLLCFTPHSIKTDSPAFSSFKHKISLSKFHSYGPLFLWDTLGWIGESSSNILTWASFLMSNTLSCHSTLNFTQTQQSFLGPNELQSFLNQMMQQLEIFLLNVHHSRDYDAALRGLSYCLKTLSCICQSQNESCILCTIPPNLLNPIEVNIQMEEQAFHERVVLHLNAMTKLLSQYGVEERLQISCRLWFSQLTFSSVAFSHDSTSPVFFLSLVVHDPLSSMRLYRSYRFVSEFLLDQGIRVAIERYQMFFLSTSVDSFLKTCEDLIHAKATMSCLGVENVSSGTLKQCSNQLYDKLASQCISLLNQDSARYEEGESDDSFTDQNFLLDIFILLHTAYIFEWVPQRIRKLFSTFGEDEGLLLCRDEKTLKLLGALKHFLHRHLCTLLHKATPRLFSAIGFLVLNGISSLTSMIWRLEYAFSRKKFKSCSSLVERCCILSFLSGKRILSQLRLLNEHTGIYDGYQLKDFASVEESLVVNETYVESLFSGAPIVATQTQRQLSREQLAFCLLDLNRFTAWRSTLILNFCSLINKDVTLRQLRSFSSKTALFQQLLWCWDHLDDSRPLYDINIQSNNTTKDGQILWSNFILQGLADLCYRFLLLAHEISPTEHTITSLETVRHLFLECGDIFTEKSFISIPHKIHCVVRQALVIGNDFLERSQVRFPHQSITVNVYGVEALKMFQDILNSCETALDSQGHVAQRVECFIDRSFTVLKSQALLMRLLWRISLWRIFSCAIYIGGEIRRDISLSRIISFVQYEEQNLQHQKLLEQMSHHIIHQDALFNSSTYFRLNSQRTQLQKLLCESHLQLALRPPLKLTNMTVNDTNLYNGLLRVRALKCQTSSITIQLQGLQQEFSQFLAETWNPTHLRKICFWMYPIFSKPLTEHEENSISFEEIAESVVFLFKNTNEWLQTLRLSYPLFLDIVESLSACFDFCFYSLFAVMPTCVIPLIESSTLEQTLGCCGTDGIPLFYRLVLAANCEFKSNRESHLNPQKSRIPRRSHLDAMLWRCECYEYGLQYYTLTSSQLASFREYFFQLCQLNNQDEDVRRCKEEEKFAHYIQKQNPEGHRENKEEDENFKDLANRLFPHGVLEEDTESQVTKTPSGFIGLANLDQQRSYPKSQSDSQFTSTTLSQDTLFSHHQNQRFYTLLYHVSYTLNSRLSRKVAEFACHGVVGMSSLSAHDVEQSDSLTGLDKESFLDQSLIFKSLGFLLYDFMGRPLPKSFDYIGSSPSSVLHELLAYHHEQLSGATRFDQLKTQYETLFQNEEKSLLMQSENQGILTSDETFEPEKILAIARRNLAVYKSQKIRFFQVRRILRNSHYNVSSLRETALAASSFYSEAWPSAFTSIYPAVVAVKDHVIKLLEEFPEHPALDSILQTVEVIFNIPVFSTTAASLVNILERLVLRCEQWEKFAHRQISLKPQILEIQKHLLLLRHHQLNDWKQLRNHREELASRAALKWVAPLVCFVLELVKEMQECVSCLKSEESNVKASFADNSLMKEKCQLLWSYLEQNTFTKPLGEFEARLQIIRMVGEMLQWSIDSLVTSFHPQQFGFVLHHFFFYCQVVQPKINIWMTSGRQRMDSAVESLLNVVAWDFSKPDALKLSIQKAHYQLSKFVANFDKHLQTPVLEFFTLQSLTALQYANLRMPVDSTEHSLQSSTSVQSNPQKSLKTILKHVLPFQHDTSSTARHFLEVVQEPFSTLIDQLSAQAAFSHWAPIQTTHLCTWLTLLYEDVQKVFGLVEVSDATHKKLWCHDLRSRLQELNLTVLSRAPNLSLVLTDTGLFTLNTVSHLVLGVPCHPDSRSSVAKTLSYTQLFMSDAPDPIAEALLHCIGSSTCLNLRWLLDLVPRLWTFLQTSFYRQSRQYTLLCAQRASCHKDLINDGTFTFWNQMSSTLLEITQHFTQELWIVSQSLSECLDLVYIFSNKFYSLDSSLISRVFSVLDASIQAIRQCLHFSKGTNLEATPQLYHEFLTYAIHCEVATKESLHNTDLSNKSNEAISLQHLLKAHILCREFLIDLPEIRVFQRDSRLSFMTIKSRQRLADTLQQLNLSLYFSSFQDPFLGSAFPDEFKYPILRLTSVPLSERRALILTLESVAECFHALMNYNQENKVQTIAVPERYSSRLQEIFKSPVNFPNCKTTFQDALSHQAIEKNSTTSGQSLVPPDYTLQQTLHLHKTQWNHLLKQILIESVLLQSATTEPLNVFTVVLSQEFRKTLLYAFSVFLTTLETAVGLGGLGVLVMKISNLLFKNGYCLENDTEDSKMQCRHTDKWTAGTGMGEGVGLNDVSQDIPDQDLLDGYGNDESPENEQRNDMSSKNLDNQFADSIDAMDASLCDVDKPDNEEGEETEEDMGNCEKGDVERKTKEPNIHETNEQKREYSKEHIETEHATPIEKTDDLIAKENQSEDSDQGDSSNGAQKISQPDQHQQKNKNDQEKNQEYQDFNTDDLSDTFSDDSFEDLNNTESQNVLFKENLLQQEEEQENIDMDFDNDHIEDIDHKSHEENSDQYNESENKNDNVDLSVDQLSNGSLASMDDDDNNNDEDEIMDISNFPTENTPHAATEEAEEKRKKEDIDPNDDLNVTQEHDSLDQQVYPFGIDGSGFRNETNGVDFSLNSEYQSKEKLESRVERNMKKSSLDSQRPKELSSSSYNPDVNSTVPFFAPGIQLNTQPNISSQNVPNPLLPENQNALQEWISRIRLIPECTKENFSDPPLDTKYELKDAAQCELNESSELKGLAETLNDNKNLTADRLQCNKNLQAQEHPPQKNDFENQTEASMLNADDSCAQQDVPSINPFTQESKTNESLISHKVETNPLKCSNQKDEIPDTNKDQGVLRPCTLRGRNTKNSTVSLSHELHIHDETEQQEASLTLNLDKSRNESISLSLAKNFWQVYGAETDSSTDRLCEQLRIVLEPTLRGRFAEGYRSGKRLSMRRVITFIASNFRRDQIWLRRSRPNRRDYRILIALDNSRSMSECGIGQKALKAIVTVSTAFQRLELGKTGLCSFGGTSPRVILPLQNNVYDTTIGGEIIRAFTFDKESLVSYDQALPELFDLSFKVFNNVPSSSENSCALQQMLLILSDGRFNKSLLYNKIHQALAQNIIPILLIIDASLIDQNNPKESFPRSTNSIFDLNEALWVGEDVILKNYLDDFPFPFYAVIQRLSSLPDILTDVIRQWIEMLNFR